jgi:purine-binding chemotaxis protein CheW
MTMDKYASGTTLQILTFNVHNAEYGVPIKAVKEIRGWTPVSRLPNTPEYLLGMMNLRGIVIPIFDLRARFGLGATTAHDKSVVIVLSDEGRTLGMLVDAVSDIIDCNLSELQPAPEQHGKAAPKMIAGLLALEQRMVITLHPGLLFPDDLLAIHHEDPSLFLEHIGQ